MKLNEGHFSSGTVIIHFWDKHYQEINFKSHLNSVLLGKWGKIMPDLHMSRLISFTLLFVLTFAMKELKEGNNKSHWNI